MFSGATFFFWSPIGVDEKSMPHWMQKLIEEQSGRVIVANYEKAHQSYCSITDHFHSIFGSKVPREVPSRSLSEPSFLTPSKMNAPMGDVRHICSSRASINRLLVAWSLYYCEWVVNVEQKDMLSAKHQELSLSTPTLEKIFYETLRCPSELQSLIVTPLWISLCCADQYLYPTRSLPLFSAVFPKQFTGYNKESNAKRFLLLGAQNSKKKGKLHRNGHDRELILAACEMMNLDVVIHWRNATHLLWCFSDERVLSPRHLEHKEKLRKNVLRLLVLAQKRGMSVVNVEWLWQSYAHENFLPLADYTLQLSVPITSLCDERLSMKDELPVVHPHFFNDPLLWTVDLKRRNGAVRTCNCMYSFTVPRLPRILQPLQGSESANEPLSYVGDSSNQSNPNTPPPAREKIQLLRSFWEQQLPFKNNTKLEHYGEDTAWVVSCVFPEAVILRIITFLKKVLNIRHVFLGSATSILILPLVVDAIDKISHNSQSSHLSADPFSVSINDLCLAYVCDETKELTAICGCALNTLNGKGSEASQHFFSLCHQTKTAIFIAHDDCATSALCAKAFHSAVTSVVLGPSLDPSNAPANKRRQNNRLNDHHCVLNLAKVLERSLHCSNFSTQDGEPTRSSSDRTTQSTTGSISECFFSSNSRTSWDVTFLAFGVLWKNYFSSPEHLSASAFDFLLDHIARSKEVPLPSLGLSLLTVSLAELINTSGSPPERRERNITTLSTGGSLWKALSTTQPSCSFSLDSSRNLNSVVKVFFKGYGEMEECLSFHKKADDDLRNQRVYQDICRYFKSFLLCQASHRLFKMNVYHNVNVPCSIAALPP